MIDRNDAPSGMIAVPYTRCADCAYDVRYNCPEDLNGHLLCGAANRLDVTSAMFVPDPALPWTLESQEIGENIVVWHVKSDEKAFYCYNESHATWLRDTLNGLPEPADGG